MLSVCCTLGGENPAEARAEMVRAAVDAQQRAGQAEEYPFAGVTLTGPPGLMVPVEGLGTDAVWAVGEDNIFHINATCHH